MAKDEFEKYVELVTSMSVDYMVKGVLSKETYVANLKMIADQMERLFVSSNDSKEP